MKKEKKGLLQTKEQLNRGAGMSALGFLLYLVLSALNLGIIKDLAGLLLAVLSTWVFVSVADARKKDKEAISYNLLWGTGALALMMVFFSMAAIRVRLGL